MTSSGSMTHEDRLYELVDGILVRKTVGLRGIAHRRPDRHVPQSLRPAARAGIRGRRRGNDPARHQLGADSRCRPSSPGIACRETSSPRTRSRCSSPTWLWRSSAGATPPRRWRTSSRSISRKESAWSGIVRPKSRVVNVYTSPDHFTRLTASMPLDGGDVLPGFSVQVGELFRLPKRPGVKGEPKKNGPRPGKKNGPKRGR